MNAKREGCLLLLLGAPLGIIIVVLHEYLYGYLFIPNPVRFEQVMSIHFCSPFGAALGVVGAAAFSQLARRRGAGAGRWPAAIAGALLLPALVFLSTHLVGEDYWIDRHFQYRKAQEWDGRRSLQAYDLYQRDLSGADLAGADLRQADLRGAMLRGANLGGADLAGADLSGADLTGANLQDAVLDRARYSTQTSWPEGFDYAHCGGFGPGAALAEIDLRGRDLRQITLNGADLRQADLRQADLTHAVLIDADLRGARLQGADLGNTRLNGADLRDADLRGADLWGATLLGADLSTANMTDCNLKGAWYTASTRWPPEIDPLAHDLHLTSE